MHVIAQLKKDHFPAASIINSERVVFKTGNFQMFSSLVGNGHVRQLFNLTVDQQEQSGVFVW
jgi:hypothetical protein